MSATFTMLGYAVLLLLGLSIWFFSRIKPNLVAPIGVLIDRLMHRRRTRIALIAIWWWLGWHFYSNVSLAMVVL